MPLTDILSAVRWWAVLTLLGLVGWPLIFTLLRPLADRGYAFVKMAGLLLVSYVFWLTGSLGLADNNGGGILLALAAVGGASWLAYRRRPGRRQGQTGDRGNAQRRAGVHQSSSRIAVPFDIWSE